MRSDGNAARSGIFPRAGSLYNTDMTKAEKAFRNYTDPYLVYGDKILLKIGHTLRVRDLCVEIAENLGLDDADTELSAVCGLLHDIGRFEQWRRYGTYNDLRSVDHGDLGAELLKSGGLLDTFSETGHDTILNVVRYHNKYQVPDGLSARDRQFTDISRDADKIDILDLFVKGGLVNNTRNTAMSGPVYQTLLDHRTIRKQDTSTKADGIAVCLAFVFDLNCRRSFEIIRETGCIDRLIDLQLEETANAVLKEQLKHSREQIGRYIDEHTAAR